MATLTGGVYAKELTDRLGIGVTLNADGSIATVNGVTIRRVTVDPNGSATGTAGELALGTNGILYVCTGGTAWGAVVASPAGGDPVTLRGALQTLATNFAANTNTETKFTAFQPVLPAAALTAGSFIRVTLSGTIKVAGATTARFRIYGTDALDGAFFDYQITNPLNNSPFRFETVATLSGAPPAAVRYSQATAVQVAGPTNVFEFNNAANNPFPSADPSAVTLTVLFGAANAATNVDISQFVVEMGVN
jgi:hypothetical protein